MKGILRKHKTPHARIEETEIVRGPLSVIPTSVGGRSLQDAATYAVSMLQLIEEKNGEVDGAVANLGKDVAGIVYLLLDTFEQSVSQNGRMSEAEKALADKINEDSFQVRQFVKINLTKRSFAERWKSRDDLKTHVQQLKGYVKDIPGVDPTSTVEEAVKQFTNKKLVDFQREKAKTHYISPNPPTTPETAKGTQETTRHPPSQASFAEDKPEASSKISPTRTHIKPNAPKTTTVHDAELHGTHESEKAEQQKKWNALRRLERETYQPSEEMFQQLQTVPGEDTSETLLSPLNVRTEEPDSFDLPHWPNHQLTEPKKSPAKGKQPLGQLKAVTVDEEGEIEVSIGERVKRGESMPKGKQGKLKTRTVQEEDEIEELSDDAPVQRKPSKGKGRLRQAKPAEYIVEEKEESSDSPIAPQPRRRATRAFVTDEEEMNDHGASPKRPPRQESKPTKRRPTSDPNELDAANATSPWGPPRQEAGSTKRRPTSNPNTYDLEGRTGRMTVNDDRAESSSPHQAFNPFGQQFPPQYGPLTQYGPQYQGNPYNAWAMQQMGPRTQTLPSSYSQTPPHLQGYPTGFPTPPYSAPAPVMNINSGNVSGNKWKNVNNTTTIYRDRDYHSPDEDSDSDSDSDRERRHRKKGDVRRRR